MSEWPRAAILVVALASLVAAAAALDRFIDEPPANAAARRLDVATRRYDTVDPIDRACTMPAHWLKRIWRGYDLARSEDIITVPQPPNYVGDFFRNSHTGPWDYVQRVPLLLYSPQHVAPAGRIRRPVTVRDIYPTLAQVLRTDVADRDGSPLREALTRAPAPPRLVVVVVWDGSGTNVLRRWPEAWPTLNRLAREGALYTNATVGSSPSITSSIHSTIGTGVYPRRHRVTANQLRYRGEVTEAFLDSDLRELALSTFADEFDRVLSNRPLAGALAWRSWHLGMLGRGAQAPGGDRDVAGLIAGDGSITGNDDFYTTPVTAGSPELLRERADELDREDGELDGRWLGHDILDVHNNPAWARYQTDVMLRIFDTMGFGRDDVPDVFFTNYKMTDMVGHIFTMDSHEMRVALHSQDEELLRLTRYLDEEVGDYLLVVTADHGSTPDVRETGAYPIDQDEVIADIDEHFDVPDGASLIEGSDAAGLFVDPAVQADVDVSGSDIARFLNGYTLEMNAGDAMPRGYEDRAREHVFAATLPGAVLDDALTRCVE